MTRLQRAGSVTESAHGKHTKHNSDDAYIPSESGQSSSSDEEEFVSRRSRSRSRAKDVTKSKPYAGSKLPPVKGSPSRSPSRTSSQSPSPSRSRSATPSRVSRPSQKSKSKSKSTATSNGSKKKKKAKESDEEEEDQYSDEEEHQYSGKESAMIPIRKGSEARKYAVAREHREGAEKREGMWHEKEKAEAKVKEQKQATAATRKAGGSSVLKFILITLVIGGGLFGLFFLHAIGTFDEFLANMSSPSSSYHSASSTEMPPLPRSTHRVAYNGRPLPVTMAEFEQNLVIQFNRIPNFVAHAPLLTMTRRKIQSALEVHSQTHLDALRALTAQSSDPNVAVDENSLEWNQAALGLLQKPKPLVLVFASQGTEGSQSAVHSVVDSLSNLSKTPFLDLQRQLSTRYAEVDTVTPRMVHDVLNDYLQAASKTKPNAQVESPFPPLYRGVVLVTDAQKLSREIAESFHQYVDDVSAPFSQVAFIFQVTSTNMHQPDAFQLVEDVLKDAWRSSNAGGARVSDDVIQPLLSRVIRNVIDIRTL